MDKYINQFVCYDPNYPSTPCRKQEYLNLLGVVLSTRYYCNNRIGANEMVIANVLWLGNIPKEMNNKNQWEVSTKELKIVEPL